MVGTTIVKSSNGLTPTPYQVDIDQTLKASKALLRHVREEAVRLQERSSKKNLLAAADEDSDSDNAPEDDLPIWLNLSTKQHIVDKQRLLPSKIKIPHTLNKSSTLSICLITADPQRAVKNAVADPSFPHSLSSRINKIIGYSKLKQRYHTFESKRQLLAEHDIFLADERIITRLVGELGKTFYKGTAKRPIPIRIAPDTRVDGKRVKADPQQQSRPKAEKNAAVASPLAIAAEIEKALNAVPVALKPGTNVAVRVGLASFTPQQLADNIKVVAEAIIEKHVVKGWRNVKAIHIKAPNSTSLPIWLAEDMWVEDENVLEQDLAQPEQAAIEEKGEEEKKKKRKRNPTSASGPQVGGRKKVKAAEDEEEERALVATRKAKLAEQKEKAFKHGVTGIKAAATVKV